MAPPRLPALLTLLAWTGAGAGVAGGVSLCTSDAARSSSGPEASVETFHSLRCTAGPDNGRDCADGEDDATYTTPEAYAVGSSRIPITWQVDCNLQAIADAPLGHRAAVASPGWSWPCMLLVAALALALGVANRGGSAPTRSATVLRRHNSRPRVSAVRIAPTRLALLVLSTLATAVSGIDSTGTCRVNGICVCSSNYAGSDCSETTGGSGAYLNGEDCDIDFRDRKSVV